MAGDWGTTCIEIGKYLETAILRPVVQLVCDELEIWIIMPESGVPSRISIRSLLDDSRVFGKNVIIADLAGCAASMNFAPSTRGKVNFPNTFVRDLRKTGQVIGGSVL
jgi:hypothetical protein